MAWSVWTAGRSVPHTVYRPSPWRSVDWLVVAGALVTAAVFLLPLPGLDRSSLFYYPYPRSGDAGILAVDRHEYVGTVGAGGRVVGSRDAASGDEGEIVHAGEERAR